MLKRLKDQKGLGIAKVLIVVVVVVLAALGVYLATKGHNAKPKSSSSTKATASIPASKANNLTTVTFTNGNKESFSLLFYAGHKTVSQNGAKLLSELQGKDGKPPITLSINSLPAKNLPAAITKQEESCPNSKVALSAYNTFAKMKVNVCDVFANEGSKNAEYLAAFTSAGRLTIVTIQGYATSKSASLSADAAKKQVSGADLSVYSADIAKIIASIKPLN